MNFKCFFLLFIFLFFQNYNAQENNYSGIKKFYYLYKYQPDSTDINSKQEEVFLLKVKETNSIFSSITNIRADSLLSDIKVNYQKNNLGYVSFKGVPKVKFSYYVEKDFLDSYNVKTYDKIASKNFSYTEENKLINWELYDESKIIAGYSCQKAIGKIYGRTFIAWFAKDLPINDGPYKFHGLPGLIVEIYDTKNYFSFKLIRYLKNDITSSFEIPLIRTINNKETDKSKFVEAKLNYDNSIVDRIKYSSFSGAVSEEKLKQLKERLKKNNNPLELKN